MLSYIYQIAHYFERSHGVRPNALYLNKDHFRRLRDAFGDPDDIEAMTRHVGMRLIISNDALHPHLAYLQNLDPRRRHAHASTPQPARAR